MEKMVKQKKRKKKSVTTTACHANTDYYEVKTIVIEECITFS